MLVSLHSIRSIGSLVVCVCVCVCRSHNESREMNWSPDEGRRTLLRERRHEQTTHSHQHSRRLLTHSLTHSPEDQGSIIIIV